MHYPEMWGIVKFTTKRVGSADVSYVPDAAESARWGLFQVYYAETNQKMAHGQYESEWSALTFWHDIQVPGFAFPEKIEATANLFRATISSADGKTTLWITQDGRLTRQDK